MGSVGSMVERGGPWPAVPTTSIGAKGFPVRPGQTTSGGGYPEPSQTPGAPVIDGDGHITVKVVAICAGGLVVVLALAFVVFGFVLAQDFKKAVESDTDQSQLVPGQCLRDPGSLRLVPCEQAHAAEVVGISFSPDFVGSVRDCEALGRAYVGARSEQLQELGFRSGGIGAGGRSACLLSAANDGRTRGSLRGSPAPTG